MELQIPRRVCSEISSESILRAKAVRYRQNLARVVQMEANKHHRSGSLPRPCAYAVGNTTENERVIVCGISERQRYTNGGATSNTSIATGSSGVKAITWTRRGKMRI